MSILYKKTQIPSTKKKDKNRVRRTMKTHPIHQTVETKMKREENLTAQHTVLRYICYVATPTYDCRL